MRRSNGLDHVAKGQCLNDSSMVATLAIIFCGNLAGSVAAVQEIHCAGSITNSKASLSTAVLTSKQNHNAFILQTSDREL